MHKEIRPIDFLSSAERRRRQAAVDSARASVGLEGYCITPEEEDHSLRFINGEINLAEFVAGAVR